MHAIWAFLVAFWGEINTPESYPDKPYEAALNQIGHLFIGALFSSGVCVVYAAAIGEMPYKWIVFSALVGGYAALIEWLQQGWAGADSIVDIGFVALGVVAPLVALTEDARTLQLVYNPGPFGLWTGTTAIILGLYIYPRVRRALTQE